MPETAPLRLVGGNSENDGRLEIFFNGEWNTICSKRWNSRAALVACKQLGFSFGISIHSAYNAYHSSGSGRIGMSYVSCSGREDKLIECEFTGWYPSGCFHSDDVGVLCSSKFVIFIQYSLPC